MSDSGNTADDDRLARWERHAAAERAAWETLRVAQRTVGARSRPADALDARTALVETLRSDKGVRFGASAYHGVPEALTEVPDSSVAHEELIAGSPAMVGGLAERLAGAAVYWVAPDIVDVLEAATATMPDQPVLASDPPAPMGFAWLPFSAGDHLGGASLRALAWDLEVAGPERVRVTMLLDRDDWCRHTGQDPADHRLGFDLFPVRWHDWTLGRAWEEGYLIDADRPDSGPVHVLPAFVWLRRFCQALWSLMAEPYVEVTAGHAGRAVTRRAQRAGLAVDELRVVTLRRPRHTHADDTSREVEWSHRWVVSGHWRRQWYPSMADHRLRYILPYVKGPDDKPVVVKDTVFALRR